METPATNALIPVVRAHPQDAVVVADADADYSVVANCSAAAASLETPADAIHVVRM